MDYAYAVEHRRRVDVLVNPLKGRWIKESRLKQYDVHQTALNAANRFFSFYKAARYRDCPFESPWREVRTAKQMAALLEQGKVFENHKPYETYWVVRRIRLY